MMSDQTKVNQHIVCTHEQAREFIKLESTFFIGICGCRTKGSGCTRTRNDVCLSFNPDWEATDRRDSSLDEALALVDMADAKGLVTRPFRNAADPTRLDGICFCCPECCYYFVNPGAEGCDKGTLREATDRAGCIDCGACIAACPFGARRLDDGKLTVDRGTCYGCGLCVAACPTSCIAMREAD
jgi:ferredoxin